MAKIGTAQIEIAPVLNEKALEDIAERITKRISEAIAEGLRSSEAPLVNVIHVEGFTDFQINRTRNCPCRPENGGSGVCGCVLGGPQITC